MMKEMCANPQLVICNSLHPLDSLRQLDLIVPRFRPVLDILDKKLPLYPNLCNRVTGKIHCKAVRQLNNIQPTAIQEQKNTNPNLSQTVVDLQDPTPKQRENGS